MSTPTLSPKSPPQSDPAVLALRAILKSQGYAVPEVAKPSLYDAALQALVADFQASHVDISGQWLKTDRIVGPKTWWALENPSGKAQEGPAVTKAKVTAPTGERELVIAQAFEWYRKPTKEIPDGSNWGGNVAKLLAFLGKPAYWCMYFLSRCFKDGTGRWPLGKNQGSCRELWEDAGKVTGARQPIGNGYVPRPGDIGVIIYGNGQGHVFLVVAVAPGTALGYELETIGGNEGNQVKLSRRDTWRIESFKGFVNLFGDSSEPYRPEGLRYTKGAAKAKDSKAATR